MAERTIPASGALAVADHELAARLARGWVLQQRNLRTPRDVAALVDDLALWSKTTRDCLVRRAGGHDVAEAFDDATGPIVHPDANSPIADQARLVRTQLQLRLRWLADLREELGDHVGGMTRIEPRPLSIGPLVVLRSVESHTADSTSAALEALGFGLAFEVVTEEVTALDDAAEARAAVVVVDRIPRTDRMTTASALALGWALGRLGKDRVLAVVARGVALQPLGDTVRYVAAEGHRRWRTEVVAWAAAATRP